MKKIVNLSFIFLLVAGSMAWAQQGRGSRGGNPEERAEKLTASMTEMLDLNESQQTEVGDLNLKFAMKMKETFEENKEDRAAMREAMKSLNQERETELASVLTDEQMQLYDEKKAEMMQRGRDRRGDRKGRGKKDSASQE
ncbi:MAG: hypothetical protein RIG62_01555 [Cyclobacteriaceae bacterium]